MTTSCACAAKLTRKSRRPEAGFNPPRRRFGRRAFHLWRNKRRRFLDQFAAHGTTTVEVKSGYGLDIAQELKILRAIRLLQAVNALDLVPTLLALHALPASFRGRSAQYVDEVIERLIPLAAGADVAPGFSPAHAALKGGARAALQRQHQAAQEKLAEFIDCFCDRGAFSVEDCRRVFDAGRGSA